MFVNLLSVGNLRKAVGDFKGIVLKVDETEMMDVTRIIMTKGTL